MRFCITALLLPPPLPLALPAIAPAAMSPTAVEPASLRAVAVAVLVVEG